MSNIFLLPVYVGIVLQKENMIFLVQRRNTKWMSGYWNFPGGLVEKDEFLKDAAIRETKEEIGVVVSPNNFVCVHVLHVRKNSSNTQDIIGVYFRACVWQGTAKNNESDKITDAQWFDLNNL